MEHIVNVKGHISQESVHQSTPEGSMNPSTGGPPPNEVQQIPESETAETDDNIEETTQTGKVRSEVWQHFTKTKVNGEDKAQCNYCKKYLGGRSKNGTTHLHSHMKTCTRRKILMRGKTSKGQTFLVPKTMQGKEELGTGTYDAENARKELAHAIIMHEYPLSIVDHIGFKRYSNALQPVFQVPCRNTIKKEIFKVYDAERSFTLKLLDSLESRVAITSDMWTLDPRFKMALLEYYFEKIFPVGYLEEIQKIQQLCFDLIFDYQSKMNQNSGSDSPMLDAPGGGDGLQGFDKYVTRKKRARTSLAKTELDHYLEEDVLKRSPDFDILMWWKLNAVKYPTLSAIAKDVLAIHVSTVASESAFSTSGHILSPHRSRLHYTTLEALMCARSWLWSVENAGDLNSKEANNFATLLNEIGTDEEGEIVSGITTYFEE